MAVMSQDLDPNASIGGLGNDLNPGGINFIYKNVVIPPPPSSQNTFEFFKDKNYGNSFYRVDVDFNKCYDVGTFNSAIFYGRKNGYVRMYTGPGCTGGGVNRLMSKQYAPSDNKLQYGTQFSSVQLLPTPHAVRPIIKRRRKYEDDN
ncbi:hypothetical protein AYI69_g3323 [Smittium culicis]|uniref:Neprosin domain-containing protein n=1 Tax=Smittium culicis TaxID=133412 RepID=A0A1R1YK53_9FUNG|nr:hypothetical protein AYI69_g3323 [Smittium culicis]